MGLVPDQRSVQQLTTAGLYPPLHERVQPRRLRAAQHDPDSYTREDLVEQADWIAAHSG
jgi:hypothetical protein